MTRTPVFAIALRGYDREQVDAHVGQLQRLLEQAEARAGEAEPQAPRGQHPDDGLSGRLAAILKLAEEEAGARRAAAQRDAALVIDDSRRRAEELLTSARRHAEGQAEAIVAEAEAEARRMVEDAARDARRVTEEAEQRRLADEAAAADAQRRYAEVEEAMSRLRATLVPEVVDIRSARGAA